MKFIPKEINPFKLLSPEIPDIPQPGKASVLSPEGQTAAAEAAARAQAEIERRKRGRSSTILTSGVGFQGSSQVSRPTVLGTI